MHPLVCEAMIAARQREIAASLARRPWVEPRAPRRARRLARVAVGTRLIGIGLRLVDPGGKLPLGHDLA